MGITANVVDGQIILASWGNEQRDRAVQVFASAAERTAQWPTPPATALSYRTDAQVLEQYNSGAWGAVRVTSLVPVTDVRGPAAGSLILSDAANTAQVGVGRGAGVGPAAGTVAIEADNALNTWNALPLVVNHRAGAGAPGIGLGYYTAGWAWSILANNVGLHVRNSQDLAYGPINASAFTVNCSAVHKANVTPVVDAGAAVDAITPVAFDDLRTGRFAGEPEPPTARIGFTAENIRDALPTIVYGDGPDLVVDQTGLIGVLWQAVKDLTARLATLEAATP